MKKQRGFTLIELIVVLVILGILAGFAIPKFMSLDKKARISTLKGLEGSVKAAAIMVRSIAKTEAAQTGAKPTSVNISDSAGTTVNIALNSDNLFPTADAGAIDEAVETDSFTYSSTSSTKGQFNRDDATDSTQCYVEYEISANQVVTSVTTDGC